MPERRDTIAPASSPAPRPSYPGVCKGCGARIYYVRTASGKMHPENADGTTHFSTCSEADRFRKSRQGSLF
jgi:hypothetical protein